MADGTPTLGSMLRVAVRLHEAGAFDQSGGVRMLSERSIPAGIERLIQQRDEARRTVAEYGRSVDEMTAMMERLDEIQQSTLAAQEQHLAQMNRALPALQRVVSERDQLIALIGRALEPWKGSPRNVMPTSVTVLIDGIKALAQEGAGDA